MNLKFLHHPISLATLFGCIVLPGASLAGIPGFPNGVSAGDVTDHSAVLWARSEVSGKVRFEVTTSSNIGSGERSFTVIVNDPMVPAKVFVDGLPGGREVLYRVTNSAGQVARGRFRTGPRLGQPFRFGVSGDWRGELSPYPAVTNLAEKNLDVFVKLGDTIYADVPSRDFPAPQALTVQDFRTKHNEVYQEFLGLNAFADFQSRTPILANIDDHEVTNDFAGGAPPSSDPRFPDNVSYINESQLYLNGLQVFHEYNAIAEESYGATGDPRTAEKIKLYRHRTYGDLASVTLLDARSFRDEELSPVQNPTDPAQIGAFLAASFDPSRTMLGEAQLEDAKADLLAAHQAGVTWKFVLCPEPIQNLGVISAQDRFEGYAAERTELLAYIVEHGIENVVFVSADIHGTLVNNLTYQEGPFQPQIPTSAFDISTGSVAYHKPFGPTVMDLALAAGLVTQAQYNFYLSLPRAQKDAFVRNLVDQQIMPLGYTPVGLEDSPLDVTLLEGSYVSLHTYGWTEFEIDPSTRELVVSTYGIDSYSAEDFENDPNDVLSRVPELVSRFSVRPAGTAPRTTEVASGPGVGASLPSLRLSGANPMISSATISFEVPKPTSISVGVFDVTGRRVAHLADGVFQGSKTLTWDGTSPSGKAAPGTYFVRLQTSNGTLTEKLQIAR